MFVGQIKNQSCFSSLADTGVIRELLIHCFRYRSSLEFVFTLCQTLTTWNILDHKSINDYWGHCRTQYNKQHDKYKQIQLTSCPDFPRPPERPIRPWGPRGPGSPLLASIPSFPDSPFWPSTPWGPVGPVAPFFQFFLEVNQFHSISL